MSLFLQIFAYIVTTPSLYAVFILVTLIIPLFYIFMLRKTKPVEGLIEIKRWKSLRATGFILLVVGVLHFSLYPLGDAYCQLLRASYANDAFLCGIIPVFWSFLTFLILIGGAIAAYILTFRKQAKE